VVLARHLGLRIVAEGVETAAQRDCLCALGCTLGQGYLFDPPLEAVRAEARLMAASAAGNASASTR
jgi:EAL domain-containing protein (putative c-di-GMP-specific phosphodiesterase class I)